MKTGEFKLTSRIIAIIIVLIGLWMDKVFIPQISDFTPLYLAILVIVNALWIIIAYFLFYKQKWIQKRKLELLMLVIVLIFSFLIIEGVLRILPSAPARYTGHPYLNYMGTPNYKYGLNAHNSLGFRGPEIEMPKPDGRFRIAVVGGSTTYTIKVEDWHNDFARNLQKELRAKYPDIDIEVINAGMGGYNSWESLINLQYKVIPLEPDLVIIYHGTNDVHTRLVNPKYYTRDNTGRRIQWEKKEWDFPLNLRTIQLILRLPKSPFKTDAPSFEATSDPRYNKAMGMTPMQALKTNLPTYFEDNLRDMIAISNEHQIPIIIATWAHSNQHGDYASTAHYEFGFEQNNQVVLNLAKRDDVLIYDFASEMPADKKYWADGRHVNELGSTLKGKLFARFIANEGIIRETTKQD